MSPDLSMFVICPAASKLTFLDSSELKSAVVTSPEVLMFVMFPELSKWMPSTSAAMESFVTWMAAVFSSAVSCAPRAR